MGTNPHSHSKMTIYFWLPTRWEIFLAVLEMKRFRVWAYFVEIPAFWVGWSYKSRDVRRFCSPVMRIKGSYSRHCAPIPPFPISTRKRLVFNGNSYSMGVYLKNWLFIITILRLSALNWAWALRRTFRTYLRFVVFTANNAVDYCVAFNPKVK